MATPIRVYVGAARNSYSVFNDLILFSVALFCFQAPCGCKLVGPSLMGQVCWAKFVGPGLFRLANGYTH